MVPSASISTLAVPDSQPSEVERALHAAARSGDDRHVRALLEAGVFADALDERGRSSLTLAAERDHLATIQVLVEAGAEVDLRDVGKPRWSALMHALHADCSRAAMALLEWGADARAGDDAGYTALMMAAGRGDCRLVDDLLTRGADPMAELFLGFTALDYAIGYGHLEIVRALLAAAPQLRHRDNAARRSVLSLADKAGEEEILALLA